MNGGFDDPRRIQAADLVWSGEQLERAGKQKEAFERYGAAAELEQEANADLPRDKPRQLSLFTLTAAELFLRAQRWDEAKRLICARLADPEGLTGDTVIELERMLERAMRDREVAAALQGGGFAALEVKLEGGVIRHGLAPIVSVRDREKAIQPLVRRVTEMLADKPFREDLRADDGPGVELYVAAPLAASYGMRFFVGAPLGQQAFAFDDSSDVTPARVVDALLTIAEAASKGPTELAKVVPEARYRQAMLRSLRELAPDGARVKVVVLRSLGRRAEPTLLDVASRVRISHQIVDRDRRQFELRGVLRGVVLTKKPKIVVELEGGKTLSLQARKGRFDASLGTFLERPVVVMGYDRTLANGATRRVAEDVIFAEAEEVGEA